MYGPDPFETYAPPPGGFSTEYAPRMYGGVSMAQLRAAGTSIDKTAYYAKPFAPSEWDQIPDRAVEGFSVMGQYAGRALGGAVRSALDAAIAPFTGGSEGNGSWTRWLIPVAIGVGVTLFLTRR